MGVFSLFRRKPKTTEEASTAEAPATAPTARAEAATDEAATGTPSSSAADDAKTTADEGPVSQAGGTGEADVAGPPAPDAEAVEKDAAEAVEIPQQQSAGRAVDSASEESVSK
ncbi:hypothetical protein [Streptomyces sp. NPDC007088]|uniref:hypothetical protein n=1 Tax=Streptomyces sp. NPDC007088 TaxID=3364773 RepID=UPI0036893EE2